LSDVLVDSSAWIAFFRGASLVDLSIALTALDSRHTLWTRDRDFSKIRKVVAIELEVF